MNRLILYTDMDGNEMVLLCDNQDFYNGVFKSEDNVPIQAEIEVDGNLVSWPTNRPLSADF